MYVLYRHLVSYRQLQRIASFYIASLLFIEEPPAIFRQQEGGIENSAMEMGDLPPPYSLEPVLVHPHPTLIGEPPPEYAESDVAEVNIVDGQPPDVSQVHAGGTTVDIAMPCLPSYEESVLPDEDPPAFVEVSLHDNQQSQNS